MYKPVVWFPSILRFSSYHSLYFPVNFTAVGKHTLCDLYSSKFVMVGFIVENVMYLVNVLYELEKNVFPVFVGLCKYQLDGVD